MTLTGLLWFLITLVPLVLIQRLLHRELQAIFLVVTRSPKITIWLFSLIFLPGVFLHEFSHFLAAKLLQVRTGRTSLIPRTAPNGRLVMGYVETAQTDIVRDSLIGLAPLVAGSLFIAYAGMNRMGFGVLLDIWSLRQYGLFWQGIQMLPQINNFWLWFYLAFAVSSTMMPSEADRHSWLPLGLWSSTLLALAIFAGAGEWMLIHITPWVNDFLGSVATLFGLSVALHIILLLPTSALRVLASKVIGIQAG